MRLRSKHSRGQSLAGPIEALGELIQTYETRQTPMPEADPREVLRYLTAEHGLRQSDLADIAAQATISDILGGRREIGKTLAKKLAARFRVSTGVFDYGSWMHAS